MFVLPYELVNRIMEYVAQLNNAKYALCVDSQFAIHFRVNIYCSVFQRINNIQLFKSFTSPPRTVILQLRRGPTIQEVEAEEMSLIPMNSDHEFELSYTYLEPDVNIRNTIYVRKNLCQSRWRGNTYEGYEMFDIPFELVSEYRNEGDRVSITLYCPAMQGGHHHHHDGPNIIFDLNDPIFNVPAPDFDPNDPMWDEEGIDWEDE